MDRFLREEPGKYHACGVAHDSIVLLRGAYARPMDRDTAAASNGRSSARAGRITACLCRDGRLASVPRLAWRFLECMPVRARSFLYLSDHDLALIARIWGVFLPSWLHHVYAIQRGRRPFPLDGRRFVESFRYSQGGTCRSAAGSGGDVFPVFAKVAGGARESSGLASFCIRSAERCPNLNFRYR